MTFLLADDLNLTYAVGEGAVVRDLSFQVERGEIFALVGPSGSGKTSVLRLIAGFERPESGRILLDEDILVSHRRFLPPEKRHIGVVFQEYALFPHLNVVDNIRFGLNGLGREQKNRRTLELLEAVQLGELAGRMPQELSGGQQQRVALARALAPHPKLILLDEAFGSLDATLRAETRTQTLRILRRERMTAILVTHDQEEALSFADRVAVMREGRIDQVGTPEELYRAPRTRFTAGFIGGTNLIEGEARSGMLETALGPMEVAGAADGPVTVSLRPEQLELTADAGAAPAEVVDRIYYGHDVTYRVRAGSLELVIRTDPRCPFRRGDRVGVRVREPGVVLE